MKPSAMETEISMADRDLVLSAVRDVLRMWGRQRHGSYVLDGSFSKGSLA